MKEKNIDSNCKVNTNDRAGTLNPLSQAHFRNFLDKSFFDFMKKNLDKNKTKIRLGDDSVNQTLYKDSYKVKPNITEKTPGPNYMQSKNKFPTKNLISVSGRKTSEANKLVLKKDILIKKLLEKSSGKKNVFKRINFDTPKNIYFKLDKNKMLKKWELKDDNHLMNEFSNFLNRRQKERDEKLVLDKENKNGSDNIIKSHTDTHFHSFRKKPISPFPIKNTKLPYLVSDNNKFDSFEDINQNNIQEIDEYYKQTLNRKKIKKKLDEKSYLSNSKSVSVGVGTDGDMNQNRCETYAAGSQKVRSSINLNHSNKMKIINTSSDEYIHKKFLNFNMLSLSSHNNSPRGLGGMKIVKPKAQSNFGRFMKNNKLAKESDMYNSQSYQGITKVYSNFSNILIKSSVVNVVNGASVGNDFKYSNKNYEEIDTNRMTVQQYFFPENDQLVSRTPNKFISRSEKYENKTSKKII